MGYDSGSISSAGVYTASATPGTWHVVATSVQDGTTLGTATVTIEAMRISPNPGMVTKNGTISFTADRSVTWSVQEGSTGGVISSTGVYQAPVLSGVFHLVAVSTVNSTVSVIVPITVSSINILPTTVHVPMGGSRTFTGSMAGVTNPMFVWSIPEGDVGGSITSSGGYTAPNSPGTYHVIATNPADAEDFATAVVMVDAITVAPNPATVGLGLSKRFSADQAVSWVVQEGASGGSISSSGIYQAPHTEGIYHVVAVAQSDSSIQVTVPVTVKQSATLTWMGDRIYGFGQLICEDRPRPDGTTLTTYDQVDQVGSPVAVTDQYGNLTGQSKNLPFGERFSENYPNGLDQRPFNRFAGHEEGDGSQIYMQARMYLPAYGRFASPDPGYDQDLGNPQSYSLYGYTRNCPVTHIDTGGKSDVNVFMPRPGEHPFDFYWRENRSGNSAPTMVAGPNPPFPGQIAAARAEQQAVANGIPLCFNAALPSCNPGRSGPSVQSGDASGAGFGLMATGMLIGSNRGRDATSAAEAETSEFPQQLYHFATNKNTVWTPQMEAIAGRYGLGLDELWNIELMPHLGRHPNAYHDFVLQGMNQSAAEAGSEQGEFLELFNQYVKQPVLENPELLRSSGWEVEAE